MFLGAAVHRRMYSREFRTPCIRFLEVDTRCSVNHSRQLHKLGN